MPRPNRLLSDPIILALIQKENARALASERRRIRREIMSLGPHVGTARDLMCIALRIVAGGRKASELFG
jgi:hypothetical protein